MERHQLTELHYITPITNIRSILSRGILCHDAADRVDHDSAAMAEIQEKRAGKRVPQGLTLHKYANLYFHARNPMMRRICGHHEELAVLALSTGFLDAAGVVIADGNASSAYTWFRPSPEGLAPLEYELVFAEWWTTEDLIEYWRRKRIKCAEVLVPRRVEAVHIQKVYVSCDRGENTVAPVVGGLPVVVDRHLFFQ